MAAVRSTMRYDDNTHEPHGAFVHSYIAIMFHAEYYWLGVTRGRLYLIFQLHSSKHYNEEYFVLHEVWHDILSSIEYNFSIACLP